MSERELAKNFTAAAKAFASADDTDGVDCGHTFNAVIVDYQNTFCDGKFNIRLFVKECDALGYDVLPLENSVLWLFSNYLNGKIVVQSKEYRLAGDK